MFPSYSSLCTFSIYCVFLGLYFMPYCSLVCNNGNFCSVWDSNPDFWILFFPVILASLKTWTYSPPYHTIPYHTIPYHAIPIYIMEWFILYALICLSTYYYICTLKSGKINNFFTSMKSLTGKNRKKRRNRSLLTFQCWN